MTRIDQAQMIQGGRTVHSSASNRPSGAARFFSGVLHGATQVGAGVAGAAAGAVVNNAIGNIGPGFGSGTVADTERLLGLQMQVQRQVQEFTTRTNIAKSEHDAKMSAVRNIRT